MSFNNRRSESPTPRGRPDSAALHDVVCNILTAPLLQVVCTAALWALVFSCHQYPSGNPIRTKCREFLESAELFFSHGYYEAASYCFQVSDLNIASSLRHFLSKPQKLNNTPTILKRWTNQSRSSPTIGSNQIALSQFQSNMGMALQSPSTKFWHRI